MSSSYVDRRVRTPGEAIPMPCIPHFGMVDAPLWIRREVASALHYFLFVCRRFASVRPIKGELTMKTNDRSTIIGVFDSRARGHQAVEELRRAGFPDSHITMVMHREEHNDVDVTDMDAAKAAQVTGESKAGEGAAIGVVAGGLGGGAVALALGMIPGIGPVLSMGTLAATIFGVGAAVGATGGGIVGGLIGADFPEDEARFYETELKSGRVLVGVRAGDRAAEARAIFDRCGGSHALTHAV